MQNFLPFWFHLDINYYYYSFKRRLKCSWLSRFTSQKCPPVPPPPCLFGVILNVKLLIANWNQCKSKWRSAQHEAFDDTFCDKKMVWLQPGAFLWACDGNLVRGIHGEYLPSPALTRTSRPNLLSSQNSCQIFSSSLISCQICCNNNIIQHRKTNITSSSLVTYNHYCFEPQWN